MRPAYFAIAYVLNVLISLRSLTSDSAFSSAAIGVLDTPDVQADKAIQAVVKRSVRIISPLSQCPRLRARHDVRTCLDWEASSRVHVTFIGLTHRGD